MKLKNPFKVGIWYKAVINLPTHFEKEPTFAYQELKS
ncbi:MAG: hypothetical protein ACJA0S_000629 [Rickettsiales bacterium]|jgi:hypothetical protein